MSDSTITIRFSRCAPPNLKEMWKQRSPIDYSMCICRLTHSTFSHVDYFLNYRGQVALLGASDNPEAPVIAGNPRGVAVRPIEYQRFAIRRDAVLSVTTEVHRRFDDFCLAQLGKPFDSTALKLGTFLSPRFDRDWRKPDAWYCAELMGRAVEMSHMLSYEYPGIKNRLSAADLLLYLAPKIDFATFCKPIAGLPCAGEWET